MRVSMKLALDDLLRSLRSRMHQMADATETGYAGQVIRKGRHADTRLETGALDDDIRGE